MIQLVCIHVTAEGDVSPLCLGCVAFVFEQAISFHVLGPAPSGAACEECQAPASGKRKGPRQHDRAGTLILPSAMTQPAGRASH